MFIFYRYLDEGYAEKRLGFRKTSTIDHHYAIEL